MSDKKFKLVLIIVLSLCIAATAFTVSYTAYLHHNCSILSYIGNER